MRVLAVLFRLFSLFGLLALGALLWFKFDTQTKQQVSFLDEVIDDAYAVLQSEKEAQWKDISEKKTAFNDVFDSNEQIPDGDENLLSAAVDALRSSEDSIYRNQDYRDRLDSTSKEYGPGSLYWDAELKLWKISDGYKLESPAGFKDPFEDESKFPFKDKKLEDGTILKGVPRHQRLRTVIGMFYKDRHDKYGEITKLRGMIVERDEELRQYQNMWAREKKLKEETLDELADTQIKLKGVEEDLVNEKSERQKEKEASDQQRWLQGEPGGGRSCHSYARKSNRRSCVWSDECPRRRNRSLPDRTERGLLGRGNYPALRDAHSGLQNSEPHRVSRQATPN